MYMWPEMAVEVISAVAIRAGKGAVGGNGTWVSAAARKSHGVWQEGPCCMDRFWILGNEKNMGCGRTRLSRHVEV
jgi:hypothetical protein